MSKKIRERLVRQIEAGFLAEQMILLDRPQEPEPRWRKELWHKFKDTRDFEVQRWAWNAPGGLRMQAEAAGYLSESQSRRLSELLAEYQTLPSAKRHTVNRIFNYLSHLRKFLGFIKVVETTVPPVSAATRTPGWFSEPGSQPVLPPNPWSLKEGGPGWGRS